MELYSKTLPQCNLRRDITCNVRLSGTALSLACLDNTTQRTYATLLATMNLLQATSPVQHLTKESSHSLLRFRRHASHQLVGVQTSCLSQFPCGTDNALGHVALQSLGFERLGDESKATGCLRHDSWVLPSAMLAVSSTSHGKQAN